MALAGAALCACSSDDLLSDGSEQKVFENDKAYMTVSINDVGSMSTKASGSEENEGFEPGGTDEYSVTNAHFYFYDSDGNYVSRAEVWNGGDADVDPDTDPNIDFKGNTVIVLKGLTSRNYPKYMVTVLNQPSDFIAAETLDELQTELASDEDLSIMLNTEDKKDFTMSTSSYYRTDVDGHYFVTPLEPDYFYEDPTDDYLTENAVDVYVERLAAKVTVKVDGSLTSTTLDDGTLLYEVDATVAGEDNDDEDNDAIGDDHLYVKINGWKLDATAKYSNIVKNIADVSTWPNTADGDLHFVWNDPDDFRSYWGMSFNYDTKESEYPTTAVIDETTGEQSTTGTDLCDYLDYTNLNDLNNMGSDEYCGENTHDILNNTYALSSKYSPAITTVLLSATVCNAAGTGVNLIRYNGELFTKTAYLNEVLRDLTNSGDLNAYSLSQEGGNYIYTHIDANYVGLETMGDGKVKVVFNYASVGDLPGGDLYYDTFETDQDGNEIFTAYTDETLSDITEALKTWNENNTEVNAYVGGEMYYLIPIEHLDDNYLDSGVLQEANYGVVRNHHYVLTITKLLNLGRGVYDPDEIIVPNPGDYNDEYYHVNTKVNIVSWKLVEQNVEL